MYICASVITCVYYYVLKCHEATHALDIMGIIMHDTVHECFLCVQLECLLAHFHRRRVD